MSLAINLRKTVMGMLIVLISVSIYALSDWERFQNRYFKKEEDLEQGYYYLETSEDCIYKVELLNNKSEFETLYKFEADSVINISTSNQVYRRYNFLKPSRLFFSEDKRTLANGLTYHYGYQYINDSSHLKSFGMVLDNFKHKKPPHKNQAICNSLKKKAHNI